MSELADVCPCCGKPVTINPTDEQRQAAYGIARTAPNVQFLMSGADHETEDLTITGDDDSFFLIEPDGTLRTNRAGRRLLDRRSGRSNWRPPRR